MKKNCVIIVLALLIASVSCKKQEIKTSAFVASIETEGNDGKTYLFDAIKVGWSENDHILVWGSAGDEKDFCLQEIKPDPRQGIFYCADSLAKSDTYWGFYPTSYNPIHSSGNTVTFTNFGIQTYQENTFAKNTNPMVAMTSTTSLPFRNVFGLLKIELKGDFVVSSIEVSDPSNALWGEFAVDASTLGIVTRPVRTDENSKVVMNCSQQLDNSVATNFYFSVPVGAFDYGFTIKIIDSNNVETTYTDTGDHHIERNSIKRVTIG